MADVQEVEVEVEAMGMAPIPTPEVLWRKPPVLRSPPFQVRHSAASASLAEKESSLDSECAWLLANDVLPTDLVTRNREVAEAALRPSTPVFMHGDLQLAHVFVDGDEVTGDVVAGYGTDVDLDVIRAWWSWRSLTVVRWLVEHGFDPASPGCEVDVLRSQL